MQKSSTVRIAGAQGFYGDSPQAALAIVREKGADYLIMDALAELTLSILQKDRFRDSNLGYALDLDFLAKTLIPQALKQGIKIISNAGGLNPVGAMNRLISLLEAQSVKGVKIACITGDDMLDRIDELLTAGEELSHLETGVPYQKEKFKLSHANVYIGAKSIAEALDHGADIVITGRVADPCLTLGILVHHFQWKLGTNLLQAEWDLLAAGIAVGHVLECGGQASGGNSYAEWQRGYEFYNLGYPIAEVSVDGTAFFSKLISQGGYLSRDTIREQLVYEIHNPAEYITPDVIVDLTQIKLEETAPHQVKLSGVKGKPRPEKLKLAMGHFEGFLSEQFYFFSFPYPFQKAQKWEEAVRKTWANLPFIQIEKMVFDYIGIGAIHPQALPLPAKEKLESLDEIGLRIAIKHTDEKTGKLAFQAITCLGLNGSPGVCSMPGWGKQNRTLLGLYPTLVSRDFVKEDLYIKEL
jgi:Acyclic terpene utilisation family protein AtuA